LHANTPSTSAAIVGKNERVAFVCMAFSLCPIQLIMVQINRGGKRDADPRVDGLPSEYCSADEAPRVALE
jgi:hypothetical protein